MVMNSERPVVMFLTLASDRHSFLAVKFETFPPLEIVLGEGTIQAFSTAQTLLPYSEPLHQVRDQSGEDMGRSSCPAPPHPGRIGVAWQSSHCFRPGTPSLGSQQGAAAPTGWHKVMGLSAWDLKVAT